MSNYTLNRKEYSLVYDALKNYHVYMDKDQRLLAEQILDFLYYPRQIEDRKENDKTGQEFREELDALVEDAEKALINESALYDIHTEKDISEDNKIKSLNWR